eukprot:gene2757-1742_t
MKAKAAGSTHNQDASHNTWSNQHNPSRAPAPPKPSQQTLTRKVSYTRAQKLHKIRKNPRCKHTLPVTPKIKAQLQINGALLNRKPTSITLTTEKCCIKSNNPSKLSTHQVALPAMVNQVTCLSNRQEPINLTHTNTTNLANNTVSKTYANKTNVVSITSSANHRYNHVHRNLKQSNTQMFPHITEVFLRQHCKHLLRHYAQPKPKTSSPMNLNQS